MEKILAVSIAAYNAENYIKKCLESFVKCKTLDRIEIFVIDDGSKDMTAVIAKEYANEYPESIKVISKENGGHGSTINTSIRLATAKYFKIVDSDDWIEEENIDLLVGYLEQNDCSLVINPYYEVNAMDGSKKLVIPYEDTIKKEYTYKFDELSNKLSWAMHAMTLRTDIIKKMGPIIDEQCFYVDAEYILFPVKDIETIVVLEYPIYNYLLGTSTQSMNILNMRNRRDQHLKVTKRLVVFFENEKDKVSDGQKLLMLKKISAIVNLQYILFMGVDSSVSYDEITKFDRWLKGTSSMIYKNALTKGRESGSGYIKLLGVLRSTHFALYKPLIGVCQRLNIIR